MRNYGKIECGFWQNPKIKQLSDNEKLLLLYLYTCPHGNAVGYFYLPDGYIMADLKWPVETVCQTVSELFRKGYIDRDEPSGMILLVAWFEHNTIENENVAKGAVKAVCSLPKSLLYLKFLKCLDENMPKAMKPYRNGMPNGMPNGIELLSLSLNPNLSLKEECLKDTTQHTAAREKSEFQKIYDAGIELFPNLAAKNASSIHAWIAAGCIPELDVIPELKRFHSTGKEVAAWSYFDKIVANAKKTRETPLTEGHQRHERQTISERADAAMHAALADLGIKPTGAN